MATTTTFHAIRDNIAGLIRAIAPEFMAAEGQGFNLVPDRRDLRKLAATPTSALFRMFEVRRHPDRAPEEPPWMDPSAYERNEWLRITVAYPVLPEMYGADRDDDIEKVMASDASLIRDAVFSPGDYVAGQSLARVSIGAPDTADDRVWFQILDVQLTYTKSQTL